MAQTHVRQGNMWESFGKVLGKRERGQPKIYQLIFIVSSQLPLITMLTTH